MTPSVLQQWVDELLATSRQQWLLRLVTVAAPLGAMLAVAAEVNAWWPFGLVVVTILAAASAFRPDSHTGIVVIVIVAAHWLATVDRSESPWLPVASVCLLTYHAVTAMTATFPAGGNVPSETIGRWVLRTAVGGGFTVALWALVVFLGRREAPGNGLLTALALAIVAGAAIMIRSRSVEDPT